MVVSLFTCVCDIFYRTQFASVWFESLIVRFSFIERKSRPESASLFFCIFFSRFRRRPKFCTFLSLLLFLQYSVSHSAIRLYILESMLIVGMSNRTFWWWFSQRQSQSAYKAHNEIPALVFSFGIHRFVYTANDYIHTIDWKLTFQ